MIKVIISAALAFSPLAFANEEMPAPAPADTASKEAAPAKEHGKHHKGGSHHGHKPDAPAK